MFTGIVQAQGRLETLNRKAAGARLRIDKRGLEGSIALGDSVCLSGVCLTVVAIDGDTLSFDAVSETLDRTTLNQWAEGVAVNLELAVTASQPLGGHIVQGHVDGVGKLVQVVRDPGDWRTTIAPPPQVVDYLVPKGSITVDGVSLTLAAVHDDGRFEIALIPETLERTTLGEAVEGQAVNLEADVLSKTVVHHLRRMQGATTPMAEPVTMDLLREAGFTG